jgi:hypothetical protein
MAKSQFFPSDVPNPYDLHTGCEELVEAKPTPYLFGFRNFKKVSRYCYLFAAKASVRPVKINLASFHHRIPALLSRWLGRALTRRGYVD